MYEQLKEFSFKWCPMLIYLTLKFADIMGVQSAGHDFFVIWLSIMRVAKDKSVDDFGQFINEIFYRNCNSYIEFSDVL